MWASVYQLCGENDWAIYVLGTVLVTFTTFCITNVILGCLDLFGLPPALKKFKIQKDKNIPMSCAKYLRTLSVAAFNMSIVVAAHVGLLWYLAKRTMTFGYELPTLPTALKNLLICVFVTEIVFYTAHRYLHSNSFLFKHIHKMHHEWLAPCSAATFYCHPLEHFFVNLSPVTLGPVLAGCHILTAWIFWVLALTSTTLAHCGYHFPFLPSPQSHDFHHRRGSDNYGAIGLLDWLLKSNQHFRKSPSSKKHSILCGFSPHDD